MKPSLLTYEAYLKQVYLLTGLSMHETGQQLIQKFRYSETSAARFAPVLYVVDYTTRSYIYVDEACVDLFGISAKEWVQRGLDGYIRKWHPDDYKIVSEKIFPENMNFIRNIPLEKYGSFVFSHNHRAQNAAGEYITVMQRSSYIPSNIPGAPVGNIGVAMDLTHFKSDLSIVHTIEEISVTAPKDIRLCYKKVYPLSEGGMVSISDREREILHLLSKGLSSKQMAAQMRISTNTVSNHRKNLLCKTGAKSSAELLNYATTHGYLSC